MYWTPLKSGSCSLGNFNFNFIENMGKFCYEYMWRRENSNDVRGISYYLYERIVAKLYILWDE